MIMLLFQFVTVSYCLKEHWLRDADVRACVRAGAASESLHKRLGARAFRECEHVEVAHFYFPPQTFI